MIHLVGIPLDGTSVNPARSLGPALFQGGAALTHIWLFILAPLVGGALAARDHAVHDGARHRSGAFAPGSDPTGADVPGQHAAEA